MLDRRTKMAPAIVRDDITGVILAGGGSSRMGKDKAMLEYAGQPLIRHVSDVLGNVFARVMLSTDNDRAYWFLGLPVCNDSFRHCGPLAGIHAALTSTNTDAIFVVACDMPLIDAHCIRGVLDHAHDATIAVASNGIRIQPLCGYYHKRCKAQLEDALKLGQYSVQEFVRRSGGKLVHVPRQMMESLTGVNTPEEYNQLLRSDTTELSSHRRMS